MALAEKIRLVCWCVLCGLCLLMQEWSDYCASFGMSLKHQCVQVGQEGVTDVQDIAGCLGEGFIPSCRILSLIGKKNVNVIITDRVTKRRVIKQLDTFAFKRILAFWD